MFLNLLAIICILLFATAVAAIEKKTEKDLEVTAIKVLANFQKYGAAIKVEESTLRREISQMASTSGYFGWTESVSTTCSAPKSSAGYPTNKCIFAGGASLYYTCISGGVNYKYYNSSNCDASTLAVDYDLLSQGCQADDTGIYMQYFCTTNGEMVLPAAQNFVQQ
jgi:hypothetical protein